MLLSYDLRDPVCKVSHSPRLTVGKIIRHLLARAGPFALNNRGVIVMLACEIVSDFLFSS